MRRLFWRIFGLILTTQVGLILAISWITMLNVESEKIPGVGISRLEAAMNEQLRSASHELQTGGSEGLRQWLRTTSTLGWTTLYVLDDSYHDLLGRTVPPVIVDAAAHPIQDEQGWHAEPAHLRLRPLETPSGEHFIAVAQFDDSLLRRLIYRRPLAFWTHMATALLLSALASLLIAFYIASPLRRIRASARLFAAGDLDARVGRLRFGGSEEMLALAAEFDYMAARIKELVEGQRRLIRDVSHEMRSPLARLRVGLELVRQKSDATTQPQLDRIEHEAEQLEHMIGQAIQLSRLETTAPVQVENVRLDLMLNDIVADAQFEAQAAKRSISIVVTNPVQVQAEAELLHSAIENVIRNALHYTIEGTSVEIHLDAVSTPDIHARIRVRDHGPGVDPADCERIFEAFYRTDHARQRASGGTGLGLAIAKRAIERQRGWVLAKNIAGGGLEIEIHLPALAS